MKSSQVKKPVGRHLSLTPVLSYGRILSIIITRRGLGKTFAATQFAMDQWLKFKWRTLMIRRKITEMNSEFCSTFFIKVLSVFPEYNKYKWRLSVDRSGVGISCCDNVEFMAVAPLSIGMSLKSTNLNNNCKWVIFDEFLLDRSLANQRYVPGEVKILANLIQSAVREDDFRLILLGNASDLVNPHFRAFGIDYHEVYSFIKEGKKEFYAPKNKPYVIQYVRGNPWKDDKPTSFQTLYAGTDIERHILNNEFTDFTEGLYEPKSATAKYLCTICFKGVSYGLYLDYNAGRLYVTLKPDMFRHCFNIATVNGDENALGILAFRKSVYHGIIRKALEGGQLRYSEIDIQPDFEEMLTHLC